MSFFKGKAPPEMVEKLNSRFCNPDDIVYKQNDLNSNTFFIVKSGRLKMQSLIEYDHYVYFDNGRTRSKTTR